MSFSYNAGQMEDGIKYAKTVDADSVLSLARAIVIPSGFKGHSALTAAINSIEAINDKVACLPNNLTAMKVQMEKLVTDENSDVINFMLSHRGEIIEIDKGIKDFLGLKTNGTIIIPEDWTPYQEYGLIINLPGYIIWSEKHASSDADEYPLLQDIYSGKYKPKGVILYTPTQWGRMEGRPLYDGEGLKKIQKGVEAIAEKLNIDKDRIALTGYSIGGYAAAQLVENNPDFYSAVAICGAAFNARTSGKYNIADVNDIIKNNPNTTFIWYAGTADDGDEFNNNYSSEYIEYQRMKEAGLNTVFYSIKGAGHGDTCWNYLGAPLINDLAYIKKGEKYEVPDGPISTTLAELRSSKLGAKGEDVYYMLLSNEIDRKGVNPFDLVGHVSQQNTPSTSATDVAIYSDTYYVLEKDANSRDVISGRVTSYDGKQIIGYSQEGQYVNGKWDAHFWDEMSDQRYGRRWKSVAAENQGLEGGFTDGCYALSITNAFANLVDPTVDPSAMGEIIGNGTNDGAEGVKNAASHYGIDYKVTQMGDYTYTLSNKNVDNFLQNGGTLICAVNGGKHYISIVGVDADGNYIVCDSYQKHPITIVENKGGIVNSLQALGDNMKAAGNGSLTYFLAPEGYTVDDALTTKIEKPQVPVTNTGTATEVSVPPVQSNVVNDTATAVSIGVAAGVKPNIPTMEEWAATSEGKKAVINAIESYGDPTTGQYIIKDMGKDNFYGNYVPEKTKQAIIEREYQKYIQDKVANSETTINENGFSGITGKFETDPTKPIEKHETNVDFGISPEDYKNRNPEPVQEEIPAPEVEPEKPKPHKHTVTPTIEPEEPIIEPEIPIIEPEEPIIEPEEPIIEPEIPIIEPEEPIIEPEIPIIEPEEPIVEPEIPIIEPEEPIIEPEEPIIEPEKPIIEPEIPIIEPEKPIVEPEEPIIEPEEPIIPVTPVRPGGNVVIEPVEETVNPETIDDIYQKSLEELESYEPKTDFAVDDRYTDVPYNAPLFEFDNLDIDDEPEVTPVTPEPVTPVVIPEVKPVGVKEEESSNVGKVIGGIAATAGLVGAGVAAKKMYDKEKEREYNNEYVDDDYNYDSEENYDSAEYNYDEENTQPNNNVREYNGIGEDDYLKEEEKEDEVQYDENGYPIQKEVIVPDEDDY